MKNCVMVILNWYLNNKRELPWRRDIDPYHIWISEIMLQQTRIEAVIKYYNRFMERIPDIKSLSIINDDELLKLWEGLGYYSRARNLKKAAIKIMTEYDGKFPDQYEDILSLPGIGEYTAAAISSICYHLPYASIDGNVMRVYCRVCNLDLDVSDLKVKKEIKKEIEAILPSDSGSFNQGIMELGEVICIPNGIPKCDSCPLKFHCLAHLNGRESLIPRKVSKNKKIEEEYTLFLIKCREKYALHKREEGLLKNMWEFPNQEGFLTFDEVRKKIPGILKIEMGITNTHLFTHKKWFMNSYYIEVDEELDTYQWFSLDEIEKYYALPTAFRPFYDYLLKK